MKHAVSLMVLFALVAGIWMSISPVDAHHSFQSVGTPTPTATKIPVKQPVLQSPSNPIQVMRSSIVLTHSETGTPGFAIVSGNLPTAAPVSVTMRTLKFPRPSLSSKTTFAPSRPKSPSAPGDFVNNWETIVTDTFDGPLFPSTPSCSVAGYNGSSYTWGQDSLRYTSPYTSISPARTVLPQRPNRAPHDGLATNNYPPNLDAWLICGPYDFTNAKLMVHFERWMDIADTDGGDFLGVGFSTDGSAYETVEWSGVTQSWVEQTVWAPPFGGQPQVWIALMFRSDNDAQTGQGVWIDDFKIWRYNNPAVTCATLDPGNKGVNIVAYDKIGGVNYPTIRAGDTQVVQGLMAAGAHWVRLPILQNNGVFVDTQAYDRMI